MLSPEREGRITGSVFAAAIGVNPYTSRQKLYREMKGIDPQFEGNEKTQWGNDHEQDAVDAYEAHTGNIVSRSGDRQEFIIHPDYDYLGCTPDGYVGPILTEYKCPYSQEIYREIPGYYMPQLQGQMEICTREGAHFVCWTPYELAIWHVEASKEYWEWMLGLLESFRDSLLNDFEPKRRKKPEQPPVKIERIK